MICPDKFTSIDNSILGKSTKLLMEVGTQVTVGQLRSETEKFFPNVSDFILALDTLFALGKIDFNESTGMLTYVD
ncbi:ABC-three component system middle component 7 [Ahrensia sp. 13_GOM-1096m]|uniref:ABC-three component system middle component 7 n=1 Tax=Ahrensia sp. 13_GOM-1096m TaxID=1380380 RepID=UPI00047C46FC|nr:ABC-three component system middle component 7 [Ahrensia sp. 13_GOM-1096m]